MIHLRHIYRYRIELTDPIRTSHGLMTHREGLIVGAEDEAMNRFVAEAAPLAGFTDETVEDVERFFVGLLNQPLDWMESALAFAEQQRAASWPVTVSSALETILVSSLSTRASFPNPTRRVRVRTYAFAPTPDAASALVEQGFRSLKIKVAGETADEILTTIERFREAAGDEVDFRIDANQRWTYQIASTVLPVLADCGVALVEEPLAEATPSSLHALRELSSVPIFADESVRTINELRVWSESVDGVVIKPMFCGGPLRALDLCRHAMRRGLSCYVTTALDAAVGRHMAAWTAEMLPTSDDYPHGLATGGVLSDDVGPPLRFEGDWYRQANAPGLREFSEEVWRRCF